MRQRILACSLNDKHRGIVMQVWMWRLPMMDVKSSGAELPAAMKVAPATSSLSWRRCEELAQEKSKIGRSLLSSSNLRPKRSTHGRKIVLNAQDVSLEDLFYLLNKLFYQQNYCFSMYICILICYCVCLSYLTQFLKGGDKVVITDNSQSTEHVYSLERQSQRVHTSEN